MTARMHASFALTTVAFCVAGCAGGGGSRHIPPEWIEYGEPTRIELEVSAWGAGSGRLSERYTDVVCRYKSENATVWTTMRGGIEREDIDHMSVVFEMPAFTARDGAFVDYAFAMKLDGHDNVRDGGRVPLRSTTPIGSPPGGQ